MYYLYIIIYTNVTIIYELIMDQRKGQLPVGLIVQLVELCTGIAEVMVWVQFEGCSCYGRTQNCKGHTLKICKMAFSVTPTVTQITSDNVFVFFFNPSRAIFMGKKIWSDSCVNYTDFEFLWALKLHRHLQRAVVERDSLVVLILRFLLLLSLANDE